MILWKLARAIKKRHDTLKLTPGERQARNTARFRQLVAFVARTSPWYRRIIEQSGIEPTRSRPEDFPILTSEMLRQNFDDIVTDRAITMHGIEAFIKNSPSARDLFLARYHVALSSGSSGIPGAYIHTTDELINGMSYAALHRQVRPRTRTSFVGPVDSHDLGAAVMGLTSRWPQRLLFNARNFNIAQPWSEIIAGLNDHQPEVLSAYKHYLMVLADEARAGRLTIRPRLLESGGEPLFPQEREILRSTFQCEIANSYGSSEVNLMGVALNDWEGIYLFEDDLIFEIDHEGTYVTSLFNKTMPLIRYRFDDILIPVEVKQPRMPFRCVSEWIGRSQELVTFEVGDAAARRLRTVFFDDGVDFSGVKRVQFQKKDAETLIVRVSLVEEAELQKLSGAKSAAHRLEQLRGAVRRHLDQNELERVRLEMSQAERDGAEPDSRIVRSGRKEKLVLR